MLIMVGIGLRHFVPHAAFVCWSGCCAAHSALPSNPPKLRKQRGSCRARFAPGSFFRSSVPARDCLATKRDDLKPGFIHSRSFASFTSLFTSAIEIFQQRVLRA